MSAPDATVLSPRQTVLDLLGVSKRFGDNTRTRWR
jgi:hypothetical protein